MSKIAVGFIVFVIMVMVLFFNTDFSNSNDVVTTIKKQEKVKKQKKDVKIIFEDKKENRSKEKKIVKKVYKESKPVSVKGMFTLSKASVGEYRISLEVPKKPKVSKFAPPSFPTFIKGEVNGEKFSLVLPNSAKKEDIYLTIVTKESEPMKIKVNSLKDTKPGTSIDIGNIMPPQQAEDSKKEEIAKDIEQKVEESVEESKNSEDQSSNSIAPPMPPAIK